MTTSQGFDELAKSLGSGLPRRSALKQAALWAAAIIGAPIGLITKVTRGDEQSGASLKSRMADVSWTCRSIKVVRLDVDEDGGRGVYPAVCAHDVRCTKAGKTEPYVAACRSHDESCPALKQCAKELFREKSEIVWNSARTTSDPAQPHNVSRFGRNCRYAWGTSYVIYRQHPDPEKKWWDTTCASPIEGCVIPETIKGSFMATCKAIREVMNGADRFMICPTVQDCLAKALPVVADPPMLPDAKK